ncbi:MAG TPA: NAD-dependent epimerase/dehydratase family protein, partial [Candidatus Baltobacteraceae bacterium]|nr:NAD-dependent epimerase/dehydratase family protein [Candidatus Baltobacteraceae bacterium]
MAREFLKSGDEVVVIARSAGSAEWQTRRWDGVSLGPWAEAIDGADVLINLAGRSVNCRYTEKHKQEIMASRIDSTRVLGEALAKAQRPPKVWLQSSTATIYSHRFDAPNDEATGIIGGNEPDAPKKWGFSVEVARSWEDECERAATPATRKVLMRTAMVMDPFAGGIFDTLLTLVKRGLGGAAAGGKQYVSWVHYRDFVNAVRWLIDRDDLSGAVNIAAPNPLPYNDFMRAL